MEGAMPQFGETLGVAVAVGQVMYELWRGLFFLAWWLEAAVAEAVSYAQSNCFVFYSHIIV